MSKRFVDVRQELIDAIIAELSTKTGLEEQELYRELKAKGFDDLDEIRVTILCLKKAEVVDIQPTLLGDACFYKTNVSQSIRRNMAKVRKSLKEINEQPIRMLQEEKKKWETQRAELQHMISGAQAGVDHLCNAIQEPISSITQRIERLDQTIDEILNPETQNSDSD